MGCARDRRDTRRRRGHVLRAPRRHVHQDKENRKSELKRPSCGVGVFRHARRPRRGRLRYALSLALPRASPSGSVPARADECLHTPSPAGGRFIHPPPDRTPINFLTKSFCNDLLYRPAVPLEEGDAGGDGKQPLCFWCTAGARSGGVPRSGVPPVRPLAFAGVGSPEGRTKIWFSPQTAAGRSSRFHTLPNAERLMRSTEFSPIVQPLQSGWAESNRHSQLGKLMFCH